MKIADRFETIKSLAIAGHVRPDGDCVGSCMGLYNYVKKNYKDIDVSVYMESPGDKFNYISGINEIKTEDDNKNFDLVIILDVSDINRVGVAGDIFARTENTICIDHHISNDGLAKENIIRPQVSSASEVLFELLDEDKIDCSVAECLYTGIIHDTGVFKYQSTTARTLEIAGKLMDKGIDFQSLIDEGFYEKSYAQNQILGKALMESILLLDGRCIVSYISKKDIEFFGVTPKDLGGIAEQLRLTKGVECAMFLYETKEMEYKVSLRSKKYIDVNKVAGYFGGGGHIRAAGCTMEGTVYDCINNLTKQIQCQIK